jgi:hypothetical protein
MGRIWGFQGDWGSRKRMKINHVTREGTPEHTAVKEAFPRLCLMSKAEVERANM